MKIKVWDIPTRLFHWLLVFLFFSAFIVAKTVDDENPIFLYHMVCGLIAGLLVLMRIFWGFFGSRYALFSSFLYGPGAVLTYIRKAFGKTDEPYLQHNPGASYAIFAMLTLVLALVLSGVLMSTGAEIFEEMHKLFAFCMVLIVAVHIIGVAFYFIRHRENIIFSMIDGNKHGRQEQGIASTHPFVGMLFLLIASIWALSLLDGLDKQKASLTIPLIGVQMQLEEEHQADEHHEKSEQREKKHDRDDD